MVETHNKSSIKAGLNSNQTMNIYAKNSKELEGINFCLSDCSGSSDNRKSSKSSGNTRTTYNYVNMIVECILRAPERRVLLSDIYKHVQNNYKDMIEKGVDWQNGIRHNLSLNDCFMKDGRNPNGKGYFWTISPKNMPFFEKGDYRRRWSQCRTRRQRDGSESRRHSAGYMIPQAFSSYSADSLVQNMSSIPNQSTSPSVFCF